MAGDIPSLRRLRPSVSAPSARGSDAGFGAMVAACVAFGIALAGCGQKGPLTLPKSPTPAATAPSASAAR